MEAHMVRRTDRPLLQVRVSFEATRSGPHHLIEAYARLVPMVQRTSRRPNRSDARPAQAELAIAARLGGKA
jgi:hypothetical protein